MASNLDGKDDFSMMQHLIDEMDASNQRIDMFSQKFHGDVNRLEALYDDAWKSEESDGASLQEVPVPFASNAGDSGCEDVVNSAIAEVSNDFLSGLRQTASQNQYADSDESRISSDNDFKILRGMASYARYPETATGLSDTDWNPYGTESDNNQSPRLHPKENGSDSKSSLFTSFTPLLNSTDINTVTPISSTRIPQLHEERMSDILERTERESTLNSHIMSQKSSSGASSSEGSTLKDLYSPLAIRKKPDQNNSSNKRYVDDHKDRDLARAKQVSLPGDDNMAASTSSTGYSSAPTGVHEDDVTSKPLSVIERAKLMGVPEEILLDKKSKTGKMSKTGVFHRKFCNSPEDLVNLSDDQLGQKVKALLSDTTHLSTYDNTDSSSNVDYTVLQKDLQEIQDNLDHLGVGLQGSLFEGKTGKGKCNSQASSEGDGEIIPSTTTTPEKRKEKMLWDFAGDLGCLSEHPGLLEEISLDTRSSSNRPSTEKPVYNSDGDETRTSDSSAKIEDHAAADQALAEIAEIIPASMRNLNTSRDVDRMVSSFQDQRRQLESRYQQLNNQGLAEKVFRILTNQNPESQANGILSEISADEKDMRTRMVLDMHDKKFDYSSTSSWLDDVNQSFNPNCDVKKRLDMSGLSSRDSSVLFPSNKGFSAIDDAKRLLSSQMAKASERTFNHSIEMKIPQTVQCYPLFVGNEDRSETNKKESKGDEENESKKDDGPNQEREDDSKLKQYQRRSSDSQQESEEETTRRNSSPTDSDHKSTVRSKDKYLPYRPPGSKQVYYIESDTASVADSITTVESTHIGSDDAKGPALPSHAFGSRKDPPGASSGIYSSHERNLSTVREDTELGTIEEKTERNDSRNSSKNDPQPSYLSHKHNLKKDDYSTEDFNNKKYGSDSIEAARRDARWDHRREEMSKGAQISDAGDRRRNMSPTQGLERRSYISSTHGIDRRAKTSSPSREVDAARRDAKWANRREEVSRESRPSDLDRRRNVSPTHGVDAARREAKWSHRQDKMDKESRGVNDEQEDEPISLRIRMTYADDQDERDKVRDREKQNFTAEQDEVIHVRPARDVSRTLGRSSPELRNTYTSSLSNPHYNDHHGLVRAVSDENLNSGYGNLSPAFRSALDSGLVRAGSDENLNSSTRDARLSPAFRCALSPELRHSIERRSPVLSRHLERSLAQPPSDYPSEGRMHYDDGRLDRPVPPTFLARERPLSPSIGTRQPLNEISDTHNAERYNRPQPRSVSPPYLERITRRIESSVERPSGASVLEEAKDRRVLGSYDLPHVKSKRKVELTLEGMSTASDADLEVDEEPLSKRTQLLKAALSNEEEPHVNQNINAVWDRFQALNNSGSSSINSSKMEAIADYLKSPSRHLMSQYMKDREEYRIERQERAERERERKLHEQQMHKHSSSEDEINERYAELLALKEEERMKRRVSKKKKGKAESKNEKDNLFSIPEDRSHDPSPSKPSTQASKHQKSKSTKQAHVIDPNMIKLRERISKQKTKVDKDMLKEMRRIEKLKKLESLLTAKKAGKITNETLQSQLDELSSTSAVISDFSHESGADMPSNFQPSDDSTTAKDSSAEMHAWKAEKERRQKIFQLQKQIGEERKFCLGKNDNHSKKSSKSRPDVSEIRLLKLVKEGYLTAEEAYKLAVERATQEGDESLDISSDNGHGQKRHKMYSPYSRSPNQSSQVRHVPKLKFSGSVRDPSYGMEEDSHQQFINDKERNLEKMLSDERHRTRGRQDRRPKSQSPSHGMTYSPVRREKSFSPSSTRRSAQPAARQQRHSSSPSGRSGKSSHDQFYSRKVKRNLQESKKYRSENDLPEHTVRESVSWDIPMNLPASQWMEPVGTQPKHSQRPLQEVTSSIANRRCRDGNDLRLGKAPRPAKGKEVGENHPSRMKELMNNNYNNIWTSTSNHPKGIPKEQWEKVVSSDALASKTNHWEVDPLMDRVQYILNKPGCVDGDVSNRSNISQDSERYDKPISKLSLQEAFLVTKQRFISKCSERQKRMKLAKEDRQLQECLRLEREAIFAEQGRLAPPNLYAHPYSENLHQPKHRIMTKHEMKSLTAKRYNKLSEVVGKKEDDKRNIEARLNRLRASLFNKKVQRDVLQKTLKLRC